MLSARHAACETSPIAGRVAFSLIYNFRNPPAWREPWGERHRALLAPTARPDRDVRAITGVSLTEHHFSDDGYLPSPMVMAGALAARTERLTLGTSILQLPLHHPVRLAEDCLLVD